MQHLHRPGVAPSPAHIGLEIAKLRVARAVDAQELRLADRTSEIPRSARIRVPGENSDDNFWLGRIAVEEHGERGEQGRRGLCRPARVEGEGERFPAGLVDGGRPRAVGRQCKEAREVSGIAPAAIGAGDGGRRQLVPDGGFFHRWPWLLDHGRTVRGVAGNRRSGAATSRRKVERNASRYSIAFALV